MRGDFERARSAYDEAAKLFAEHGLRMSLAGLTQVGVPLELLAGDPEAAEREARKGHEIVRAAGLGAIQAPLIAETLLAQDRVVDAAEALGELGDGAPQLPHWQVKWRTVRARLELAGGHADRAVAFAEEAVAVASATDDPTMGGEALHVLCDALAAARRHEEASEAAELARRSFEAKGHVAAARRLVPVTAT
jgi:hypothetical protein